MNGPSFISWLYFLTNIELTFGFNSNLACDVILGFNCNGFQVDTDERVCDTNGNLYMNFCAFDQARCKDKTIEIDSSFACLTSPSKSTTVKTTANIMSTTAQVLITKTVQPSTTKIQTTHVQPTTTQAMKPTTQTMKPTTLTMKPTTQTMKPITQTMQPTSLKPSVTLTTMPTTTKTTLPSTTQKTSTSKSSSTSSPTTQSLPHTTITLDPLAQMFCDNKDIISCTPDPNKVCGTDGKTYENNCEFAKVQCDIPTLKIQHAGEC